MIPRSFFVVAAMAFACCGGTQATQSEGKVDTNFCAPPCVRAKESLLTKKNHRSSTLRTEKVLRWNIHSKFANKICNHNNHKLAEDKWYYMVTADFLEDTDNQDPIVFFDVNTGKHLFTAPLGRSKKEFLAETYEHGWPSFRDDEVNWDNVRVIPERMGEVVSIDGTHLGHNNPDEKGNRYCINVVCVAGHPKGVGLDELGDEDDYILDEKDKYEDRDEYGYEYEYNEDEDTDDDDDDDDDDDELYG